MANDKVQVYTVLIIRRDGEHISALETETYDQAFELWTELKDQWLKNLKEHNTFELLKPIVTAFDPGLISEIKIIPFAVSKAARHNPYALEMERTGFNRTFGKATNQGSELLDSGYK
jgi:hypothetical protein